jgi:hypothetical protein
MGQGRFVTRRVPPSLSSTLRHMHSHRSSAALTRRLAVPRSLRLRDGRCSLKHRQPLASLLGRPDQGGNGDQQQRQRRQRPREPGEMERARIDASTPDVHVMLGASADRYGTMGRSALAGPPLDTFPRGDEGHLGLRGGLPGLPRSWGADGWADDDVRSARWGTSSERSSSSVAWSEAPSMRSAASTARPATSSEWGGRGWGGGGGGSRPSTSRSLYSRPSSSSSRVGRLREQLMAANDASRAARHEEASTLLAQTAEAIDAACEASEQVSSRGATAESLEAAASDGGGGSGEGALHPHPPAEPPPFSARSRSNLEFLRAASASRQGKVAEQRRSAQRAVTLDPAAQPNWVGRSLGAPPPLWVADFRPGGQYGSGGLAPSGGNPKAYLAMARVEQAAGRYGSAMMAVETALQAEPSNPLFRLQADGVVDSLRHSRYYRPCPPKARQRYPSAGAPPPPPFFFYVCPPPFFIYYMPPFFIEGCLPLPPPRFAAWARISLCSVYSCHGI